MLRSHRSVHRVLALLLGGALAATLAPAAAWAEVAEPPETGEPLASTGGSDVRVAEMTNTGPAGNGDLFFEIVNYGDEPQPLDGWSVYRCIGTGVRASVPQLSSEQLAGRTLEPGQRLTAARADQASPEVTAAADLFFTISFATQYGLIIFDDAGHVVDRVGSARADVESYCANGSPLPGTLSGLYAESWQRVGLSGDARVDFVTAPRTPGAVNARQATPRPTTESDVAITELTNGGPGGAGDNFFELTNLGTTPADLTGWQVFRCTGTGRIYPDTRQLVIGEVTLAPGESWVAGRENGFTGTADATYGTSVATDGGFGFTLTDAELRTVDTVGVFTGVDSACGRGEPAPNDLDFGTGESWQRVGDTGSDVDDFVRALRTPGSHGRVEPVETVVLEPGDVQLVEVTNGGPGDETADDGGRTPGAQQFVELAARTETAVDVSGWQIHYCGADGRRFPEPQAVLPAGTVLDPGQSWTLVGPDADAELAAVADARAAGRLPGAGYGVLVLDAEGAVVDRVSVLYDDVGVVSNAPPGPCRAGVALDRRMSTVSLAEAWAQGLSFHRTQYTGDNFHDWVPAPADPGQHVQIEHRDPAEPLPGALDPVDVPRVELAPTPTAATAEPAGDRAELTARARPGTGLTARGGTLAEDASVRTFTGVSAEAPLGARTGPQETAAPAGELATASDDRHGYPYLRMEVEVETPEDDVEVVWTGSTTASNELQLYVWGGSEGWRLVDARSASGTEGGATTSAAGEDEVTLVASLAPGDVVDGVANLLVQDGPRTRSRLVEEVDQEFQTPGSYDFAIGHLTDTQYVTEQNPTTYTALNSWFAANAEARDIGFVMHTGDVIQNWLRGDQRPDRAVEEFEFASRVQQILEDAGVPHSVLPGNHDNVWGASDELFDEYFPASRYADFPWFGEVGPEGMSAHYDLIERDGVRLLLLSMGYDSSDAELAWASDVIAAHPDHNVVLGTHEYLRPEIDERANPGNGRWVAQGDVFFEQLVEPHDNVVMVMSGHLSGVRQRVLTDVGGTPGRQVLETVADYQSYVADGARDALFLRLWQFDVDAETVALNAYSPTLDSFEPWQYEVFDYGYTAESDEQVLPLRLMHPKRVATSSVDVVSGVAEVATTTTDADGVAAMSWDGLTEGESYGWYVVDAESGRVSSVSSFRAGESGAGPGDPGTGDPGVEDPEAGDPGDEDPGAGAPGGDDPDAGGPGGEGPRGDDPVDDPARDPIADDPGGRDSDGAGPGAGGGSGSGAPGTGGSGGGGSERGGWNGAGERDPRVGGTDDTGIFGRDGVLARAGSSAPWQAAVVGLLALLAGTGLLLRRRFGSS